MRRLSELAREFRTPMHAAFVDFRKAFDSVNRDVLWSLLLARGVAPKLVALIQDLYRDCAAKVTVGGHASNWFPMTSGVRQGCRMSLTLFIVFMDFLARLLIQHCQEHNFTGVSFAYRINGQLVSPPSHADTHTSILLLLYADDLVLLADSAEDLGLALRVLEEIAACWGMCLNYGKTEAVVFGAQSAPEPAPIQLQHGQVKWSTHFRCLGSIVEHTVQQQREIDTRIRMAGLAFRNLNASVFKHHGVALATKMRLYKAIVVPTLIYGGAETWALTQAQEQQLDVFNTSCLRRILGIRLGPDVISNADLYARCDQAPISALLRAHRLRWLGHVARMDPASSTVHQLLFAKAPSHHNGRGRGAPQTTWPRAVWHDLGLLSRQASWLQDCQDRSIWRDLCDSCSTVA